MAYDKQTWVDGAQGGTPVSAARLQHLDDGVAALDSALAALVAAGILTPTQAGQTYATIAQGAKADTAVQPAALTSALAGKADTATTYTKTQADAAISAAVSGLVNGAPARLTS